MEGTMRDRERGLHVRCWIEGSRASPFKGCFGFVCYGFDGGMGPFKRLNSTLFEEMFAMSFH